MELTDELKQNNIKKEKEEIKISENKYNNKPPYNFNNKEGKVLNKDSIIVSKEDMVDYSSDKNPHNYWYKKFSYLGKTFIVNSPGNFENSFNKLNGDATSIVNLYFNKNTKKFIGSSIIPMITQEYKPKYFRAMPIFKIFKNSFNIASQEFKRIKKVHKLITKIMIGKEIPLSKMEEKYY